MTAEARLIESMGIPVTVRDVGVPGGLVLRHLTAGSGPAMALFHGLNIGWGEWHAVIPELAKTHTVHAFDLPGSGGATRVDFQAEGLPDILISAVEGALETLLPPEPIIVGHSIGAWLAIKSLARRPRPVRALVAIDPLGFSDHLPLKFRLASITPVARLLARTVLAPTREKLDDFLAGVLVRRESARPEYLAYVHEHVTRSPVQHPLLLISRLSQPFRVRPEFLLNEEEIVAMGERPTLFIHGEHDPLIPLADVAEAYGRVSGARTSILPGTGHVPPIERPAETVALIQEFVSSLHS